MGGTRGGIIGTLIENIIPAGYTFCDLHDNFVDKYKAYLPDLWINIPTMLPMYVHAVFKELSNSLTQLGFKPSTTVPIYNN